MKLDQNVPEIRFKGFDYDWEVRNLGDIADVTKLAGFEFTEHVVYSEKGNIIALRGLNIKKGLIVLDDVKYIDGSNFSKLNRSKLYIDDIMFTYVGTVGEVAIIKENDRFYLAPNVSRIRIQSDDSPKFVSHYMRTDSFYRHVIFPLIASSSQPALTMENIRKFVICLPSQREEQDKLSEYFDSLDNLITLHQRKLDKLHKVKEFFLSKLFPMEGSNVPEIRFKGFSEPWELRKVSELLKERREATIECEDYPLMAFIANIGVSPKGERYDRTSLVKDAKNKLYKKTELGDFIYSSNNLEAGSIGLNNYGNACISPVYSIFKHTDIADYNFIGRRFIRKDFIKDMIKWRQGVVYGQWKIHESDFLKIEITVPSLQEQRKIGGFFHNIDEVISLYQRKLDKLKLVKSYFLKKMFV